MRKNISEAIFINKHRSEPTPVYRNPTINREPFMKVLYAEMSLYKKETKYKQTLASNSFVYLISSDRIKLYDRDKIMTVDMIRNLKESVLNEVVDENDPIFKSWFAGSKVVDRNGPRICYHGTGLGRSFEISKFYPFTHFGTLNAASAIIFNSAKSGSSDSKRLNKSEVKQLLNNRATIYPVYLKIKNPILFVDHGIQHDPSDFLNICAFGSDVRWIGHEKESEKKKLNKQFGKISLQEYNNLRDYFSEYNSDLKKYTKLASVLIKKGYDGFVYKNMYEHKNTFSWIILSPNQVWPLYMDDPKKSRS